MSTRAARPGVSRLPAPSPPKGLASPRIAGSGIGALRPVTLGAALRLDVPGNVERLHASGAEPATVVQSAEESVACPAGLLRRLLGLRPFAIAQAPESPAVAGFAVHHGRTGSRGAPERPAVVQPVAYAVLALDYLGGALLAVVAGRELRPRLQVPVLDRHTAPPLGLVLYYSL